MEPRLQRDKTNNSRRDQFPDPVELNIYLTSRRFQQIHCTPIEKPNALLSLGNGIYVYIIDQAQGQDGWILAEFSFFVFMDRDEVEVHKNVKRERGQYPVILTELAWSIKDLLYGIKSTEKNDLRTCLFSSTEKEPS